MDWVRTHYERAAVLAAALFLLVCAIFIWLAAGSFQDRFALLQNAPAPNNKIPEGGAPALADAMHRLQMPPQWTFSGRSGLFVPEKHFIGENGEPATLQNTILHPPVPNEWIEEFDLPIGEGDVLTQDPDGDGFTDVEEWAATRIRPKRNRTRLTPRC
ncbi:MAG: Amuc_1099 family pilus-like system protein [Chthoniobacterales bacterium]